MQGTLCWVLYSKLPIGPLSSSVLGLPYRILNISHKKELLRGLWVRLRAFTIRAGMVHVGAYPLKAVKGLSQ